MSPRVRKIYGGVGIVVFLAAYAALAVTIADHLPDNNAVKLVYFVVVGIAWGLPLIPLLSWMDKGR